MEELSNRIEVPFRNIKTLNNLNLIDLISFTQPSPLILKDKIINSSGLCHVCCSWSSLQGAHHRSSSLVPDSTSRHCPVPPQNAVCWKAGECSETCFWPPGAASARKLKGREHSCHSQGPCKHLVPLQGPSKPDWRDHWGIQIPLSVLLSA